MSYKLYIHGNTWMHPKNKLGLDLYIKNGFFNVVNNINDAQIILSMSPYPINSDRITNLDILNSEYKNKLILLGPHFCVLPTPYLQNLNTEYSNIYFNLLSDWVSNFWQKYLKGNMKTVTLPYPVDIDRFCPDNTIQKKNDVFIYLKFKKTHEVQYIINFLKNLNFNVKIFNYEQKYSEEEYISYLKKSCFGIWIGINESQGFALQEALSCNVPLLVHNVKNMGQQPEHETNKTYCDIESTTVPFWDNRCGELFYSPEEFEKAFLIFIVKLTDYKPREFILENLETKNLFNKKWKPLIEEFFNNNGIRK